MEKFLGSFKVIEERTENFDNYFKAMKIPDETREAIRKSFSTLVTGLAKAGEGTYREFNDYGSCKEEFTFKLGEQCTTTTMNTETKNVFTLNGDRLDGVHDIAGERATSSRYFQGDILVFESEGKGEVMKTYFTKISD